MSVRNDPLCMAPFRVRAIARGASPPDTRKMYFTVISGNAEASDNLTPFEAMADAEACSLLVVGLIVTTKPSSTTRLAGSFKEDPMVDRSASLKFFAETSANDSPPTI